MKKPENIMPGVMLVLLVAFVSFMLSLVHVSFDPLVVSIVIGLLLSPLLGGSTETRDGIALSLRLSLPSGIALYGMSLDFSGFAGGQWPFVSMAFALMFGLSFFFSMWVAGLGPRTSLLIASGLSVCGASAIIVMATVIGAEKEETAVSIISVMLVGLFGVVVYRFLPGLDVLGPQSAPLLVGTTLPMLGQVKVSARGFGPDALVLAVNYKLVRISMLAALSVAALFIFRKGRKSPGFPWFMVVFLALAVLSNISGAVASLRPAVSYTGTFLLTVALTSMGLSIDLESVMDRGGTPPMAAGVSWLVSSLIISLLLFIIY